MKLLTYTPPERRIHVIHHEPSFLRARARILNGPMIKVTAAPPKRFRKGFVTIRVQLEVLNRNGVNQSVSSYVTYEWERVTIQEAAKSAIEICADRWIDDVLSKVREEEE